MSAKLKIGIENFAKERNFMKKNLAKVVTLGLLTASVFVVSGYDNKCLAGDPWGIWGSQ